MEEAAPRSQASFEFVQPVDRTACLRHAQEKYNPLLWDSLGGLEARYLGDEYVPPEANSIYFQVLSAHEVIPHPAAEVEDLITEETLSGLIGSAENAGSVWAAAMLEGAIEAGLAYAQEEAFAPDDGATWAIVRTADDAPVLTVAADTQQGIQGYAVNLDTLHARDPEFVRAHIRIFHQTKLRASLGHTLKAAAEAHEIPVSDIVPDFMLQIAALPPEERAMAQSEILQLLTYFAQVDQRISDRFYRFRTDWSTQQAHDTLQHLAECPTQSGDVQAGAANVRQFYQHLDGIRASERPSGRLTEEQMRYLPLAYRYLPNRVAFVKKDLQVSATEEQAFAEFVDSARETSDPARFLARLEAEMPQVFQKYVDFGHSIGPVTLIDSLDRAIEATVQRASLFNKEISSEGLMDQLEQQITMLDLVNQVSGIGRVAGRSGGSVKVTEPQLRSLLLQLVCKHARSQSEAQIGRASSETEVQEVQNRLSKYEEIEKGLVDEHQERARQYLTNSARFTQEVLRADAARRSLGLSDEDMAWLAQMLDPQDIKSFDQPLFDTVFHTLLAERRGIIRDLTSPIVLSFVREFLKDQGVLHAACQQKLLELGLL